MNIAESRLQAIASLKHPVHSSDHSQIDYYKKVYNVYSKLKVFVKHILSIKMILTMLFLPLLMSSNMYTYQEFKSTLPTDIKANCNVIAASAVENKEYRAHTIKIVD